MLEIKVILWHKFKAQPMGTCTCAHAHTHTHARTHSLTHTAVLELCNIWLINTKLLYIKILDNTHAISYNRVAHKSFHWNDYILLTTRRLGTVTTEKIYQCFPQLLIFHENNDPDR